LDSLSAIKVSSHDSFQLKEATVHGQSATVHLIR